jgi:prefoldin subunit 5
MPASVVFVVLASLAAITVWVYVGVKYGARTTKPEELDAIEKRLARLEVAIDDMTAELARLSDGQQFVGKLLEQRALEGSRGTV